MRIINAYITRKLVFTTLATVAVLTFVMLSGNLIRAFDLLARGIAPSALAQLLLYLVPVALKFTIPFSLLCSCILVFSRLSADRELTAMRASGISLWQVISPALMLSILFCVLTFYLQMTLGPRCRYVIDSILETEGLRNPLAAIEPGRFVELPGYVVYVERREEDRLFSLHIYGLGKDGRVVQDITAREGRIVVDQKAQTLQLFLDDATVVAVDPAAPQKAARLRRVAGDHMTFPLAYGEKLNRRGVTRRFKHLDSQAMFGMIHVYTERGIDTTPIYVELHRRMSLALSPLAFVLVGIPFGVRTRRAEPAVGIVIALVLATFFFAFLILANNLKYQAGHHPELLVWLPNILYQGGGLVALWRMGRH